mgnify:FL=1
MPRKKNIKHKPTTINICPCGVEALGDTMTWTNLGGHVVLLCWNCADILHTKAIAEEKKNEI